MSTAHTRVVIIDYGLGNLGSIQNMLKKIGCRSLISNHPQDIEQATKLILPGVGAFDTGMHNLNTTSLVPLLSYRVLEEKVPILGICLGMQLLTRCSEEGERKERGLGWIQADTVRFKIESGSSLRLPHMGWNFVDFEAPNLLTQGMSEDARFYFVHSYHPVCDDPADQMFFTTYGYRFASGIHKNNIYGVQFHPEKSHMYGMVLLKNFVEYVV